VTAPIGTGPYRVVEFSPPQSMRLEAFDRYWGEPPAIPEARYLAVGRAETRALMAESGDANLVFTLDPAGYARLAAVPTVETRAEPIPRVLTLKVDAAHPYLSDPRARRALSLAVDRAGIATGLLRAPETAATQLFPPALGAWHESALPSLAHDPAEASRLFAELGWQPGADGVLVRAGERFALTLRTFPDRPELPLIAAALQDQWRAVGIDLTVAVGNFSEIPAGHQDGSLQMGLYARNYGLTPDPIGTLLQDFADRGGDWGAMNWDRADVTAALRAIAAEADPDERAPHVRAVVVALQEDLPVIPIAWYRQSVAIDRRLQGVVVDPLERSYGLGAIRWAE
jgi:peptide/nickel transport system substrate-binding protein